MTASAHSNLDPRLFDAGGSNNAPKHPYPQRGSVPGVSLAQAPHPFSQPHPPSQPPVPPSQPYYHLSPTQQQPPSLVQHASPATFDQHLAHATPSGTDTSPLDDDDDHVDDHDGEGAQSTPGAAASPNGTSLKRPRACDKCRELKVRCDQTDPANPCKRCAKAGRQCHTTPATRKRTKKADSRVAELERQVNQLMSAIQQQTQLAGLPQLPPPQASQFGRVNSNEWPTRYTEAPLGYGPAQGIPRPPEAKKRKMGSAEGDEGSATMAEDMDAIHRDLADYPAGQSSPRRGMPDHTYIRDRTDSIVPAPLAAHIFYRYVNEICPHFPAVPLRPGVTVEEIRETKPLLFLAILASASHGCRSQSIPQEMQRDLTQLLKDTLAKVIWCNGEKSIEIIQAMHLGVLWYRPPQYFEQHNFYLMVNSAAVLALDLGLGRREKPLPFANGPFQRYPPTNSIEARRTYLVCYYLCMSITMILRRPIVLRWNRFTEESITILETSDEAYPSDKILCQHVKLAHIGEIISVEFSVDDPAVELSFAEHRVTYALKSSLRKLMQVRAEDATISDDPTLKLAEHVTNLYIHEIALHQNQSANGCAMPYDKEDALTTKIDKNEDITPCHIGALEQCFEATHAILDTILAIPFEILLTLPVIFCIRGIYAIVCLMRLWIVVSSNRAVAARIPKESLQIEHYTESLLRMFQLVVQRDHQSPHGKFHHVVTRLQDRFERIKEGHARSEAEAGGPPLKRERTSTTVNQTPLHLLSDVAIGKGPGTGHPAANAPQGAVMQTQQQAMAPAWYDSSTNSAVGAGMPSGVAMQAGGQVLPGPSGLMGMPQPDLFQDPFLEFSMWDIDWPADLTSVLIPNPNEYWSEAPPAIAMPAPGGAGPSGPSGPPMGPPPPPGPPPGPGPSGSGPAPSGGSGWSYP